jgi:hypothetical protein
MLPRDVEGTDEIALVKLEGCWRNRWNCTGEARERISPPTMCKNHKADQNPPRIYQHISPFLNHEDSEGLYKSRLIVELIPRKAATFIYKSPVMCSGQLSTSSEVRSWYVERPLTSNEQRGQQGDEINRYPVDSPWLLGRRRLHELDSFWQDLEEQYFGAIFQDSHSLTSNYSEIIPSQKCRTKTSTISTPILRGFAAIFGNRCVIPVRHRSCTLLPRHPYNSTL